MDCTLIVCTYKRALAIEKLFASIGAQTLYPDTILIIDASPDNDTKELLTRKDYKNTDYYKVTDEHKGLTKQRNFGINQINTDAGVVCFLDDDVILEDTYFERLMGTYTKYPEALGVGGYIANEVNWYKCKNPKAKQKFYFDGYCREEPLRFRVRSFFGLAPDTPPCYLPTFSHGRSVSFLPPSGKTYNVEQFMGGVASYKVSVFKHLKFSNYFEGYGLYEDADFCLRLSKIGTLYVNTSARLGHYHEASGRPNSYKYGKMVVRNGWYIWRVKYHKPKYLWTLKWYLTEILLMFLTVIGALKNRHPSNGINEGIGRFVGLMQLIISKPTIDSI
jgi:GT2 family glycosyltransferase